MATASKAAPKPRSKPRAASRGAAARKAAAEPGHPRALRAGPSTHKSAPAGRVLRPEADTVTLEEVMVNFQRSLARATRASLETSRADMQVGMGQRALYMIDGIGVTLHTGVLMARDAAGRIQSVAVDLGAPPGGPGHATLEFRVATRPIDPIASEQLILADLDPLGLHRPRYSLRITLIGRRLLSEEPVRAPQQPPPQDLQSPDAAGGAAQGGAEPQPRILSPLPGRTLHLYLVGTTTGATEIFVLTTNAVGQVDVEIDALANRLTSGDRSAGFQRLDLARHDSEFFVWAACRPELADGVSSGLTSNVLQCIVKRQATPGVS